MTSNSEVKNSSLSSLEQEEPSHSSAVPVRNAVSSVKRLRAFQRTGKLNLKPFRLTSLTKEILEAANEPLKEVVEAEDGDENESGGQNSGNVENSKERIQVKVDPCMEAPEGGENFPKNENSRDLGVTWLETPAKAHVYSATPSVHADKKDFVTPKCVVRIVKDDKTVIMPSTHCNVEPKSLLKTPVNNCLPNTRYISQSGSKLSASRNGCSALRSIRCDPSASVKRNNTRNLNTLFEEENNENATDKSSEFKVQFSLPVAEFTDHSFKKISVKGVTYIILNQLGKGGSSEVYHCYDLEQKSERAIKKVNLGSDTNAVGYINEVQMLAKLQKCDRIVKMYDYEIIDSENVLLVVLERGGSDLSKILRDLSGTSKHLPMHMLIFYWMEMLYAVKQIHENGIIHSDLKPGNFLRAEGGLKLIDFGIASCVQEDMTSVVRNIPVGSFNYISPEALTNESSNNCDSPSFGKPKFKVSYKSDVWSLGCILYQLVYRRTPFQHITHMWTKLGMIINPQHKIEYPEVNWVPSKIVNTIKSCLQYDMKARPSVDELISAYENIYN